jgi:hypothetical protein
LRRVIATQIPRNCFKVVSRIPQNGFIGRRKRPLTNASQAQKTCGAEAWARWEEVTGARALN